MNALNLFIPITKVDAAQRLVYGVATAEREDRAGEICDYASTKPNYQKWSRAIAQATDGRSLGNLRAMHGRTAAGKITALAFDDAEKEIEICAKVVDDAEWDKVCEGVYTGFSQGGAYVDRWRDEAGLMRYTADPSEISLVDATVAAGARCGGAQEAHGGERDADGAEETAKAFGDGLTKAIAGIQSALNEVLQRLTAVESQPGPLPGSGLARLATKGEELIALTHSNPDAVAKFIDANREALALEAIKSAQRRPQLMGARL